MRKSFYMLLIGLFLSIPCLSQPAAQNIKTKRAEQLLATLRPEKETVMLGETTFLIFELKNFSGADLYTPIGLNADTNGRPTIFNVTVTDEDGKSVPQPPTGGMHGFGGVEKIPANGSYVKKLYLPHWASFVQAGTYSVKVRINLNVFDSLDSQERFPVELGAKIKIVPNDDKKLGETIDKLGTLMLDGNNPESVDAASLFAFIEDPRVVKYHARRLQKFMPGENEIDLGYDEWMTRLSIWCLRLYNDDSALEALKKLMDVPNELVRSRVAESLSESPHPKAFELLLKMRNDKSPLARLAVVARLEKIDNEESNRLLREMSNDNDQWVREKVQEILYKRRQKKSTP